MLILIIVFGFLCYYLIPIIASGLFGLCFIVGLLLFLLFKTFSIPWLIYNGKLEPTWRSIPRIWKLSDSWTDFFFKVHQHDKSQINIVLGI